KLLDRINRRFIFHAWYQRLTGQCDPVQFPFCCAWSRAIAAQVDEMVRSGHAPPDAHEELLGLGVPCASDREAFSDGCRNSPADAPALGVRCRDGDQGVGELSGGNQQKVALARLLHQDAEVLLLDEPTRGVDVGAKVEIYRLLGELAAQGKALLVVSSYFPELLGVCDRIAVMHRGRLGAARSANEWTETT
ncbi:MAG: ATP-binding cassette domain-containing protein, partial [Pseudomonadota bacterium]|nr:ATP-binding cassette domain-containing protein [Pseudomonadota bacterium]